MKLEIILLTGFEEYILSDYKMENHDEFFLF